MSSHLADNFFSPVPVQSLFYQLPDLLTLLSSSPVDGRSNVSGTHVNLAVHHVVVMDECLQRVAIVCQVTKIFLSATFQGCQQRNWGKNGTLLGVDVLLVQCLQSCDYAWQTYRQHKIIQHFGLCVYYFILA